MNGAPETTAPEGAPEADPVADLAKAMMRLADDAAQQWSLDDVPLRDVRARLMNLGCTVMGELLGQVAASHPGNEAYLRGSMYLMAMHVERHALHRLQELKPAAVVQPRILMPGGPR